MDSMDVVWEPVKMTDKTTGRSVWISIFEKEMYLSGFFTFEDFWNDPYRMKEQKKA